MANETPNLNEKLFQIEESRQCLLNHLAVPESVITVLNSANQKYDKVVREMIQTKMSAEPHVSSAKHSEASICKQDESFTDADDLCQSSENDVIEAQECNLEPQVKKVPVVSGLKFN